MKTTHLCSREAPPGADRGWSRRIDVTDVVWEMFSIGNDGVKSACRLTVEMLLIEDLGRPAVAKMLRKARRNFWRHIRSRA